MCTVCSGQAERADDAGLAPASSTRRARDWWGECTARAGPGWPTHTPTMSAHDCWTDTTGLTDRYWRWRLVVVVVVVLAPSLPVCWTSAPVCGVVGVLAGGESLREGGRSWGIFPSL